MTDWCYNCQNYGSSWAGFPRCDRGYVMALDGDSNGCKDFKLTRSKARRNAKN